MKNMFLFAALLASAASAQDPGYAPSSAGITVPTIAYASLPPAAQKPNVLYYSPDAPGGASLEVSDGTTWKTFARGYSSQTYTLTSTDNGVHTFTFSMTAKPNVQFSIEDNTTTGLITSSLYNVTTTQATVRVNRGLISGLLTGGSTTGVVINLFVVPTN